MNTDFLKRNRTKFQEKMEKNSVALVHANTLYTSSADMHFPFEADRDFYYLTGLTIPDFFYFAEKTDEGAKETLFVYRKDELEEKWTGYRYTKEELCVMSGIENIAYLDQFYPYLASVTSKNAYQTAYINTPRPAVWKTYKTPQEMLGNQLTQKYPYFQIKHLSEITVPLRVIKEPCEVEFIRQAAEVTNRGLQRMMRQSRAGICEKELEAAFAYEVIKAGMRMSFPPIIASGANALVLHYDTNNSIIEENSLVLADVGASKNYYCADVTRTFPASGKFTDMQRKIYEVVLASNESAIACIKEGVKYAEIEECAQSTLRQGLKRLELLKSDDELSNYYYHTIGHGLGLNAHDALDKTQPLKEGMVVTIEPGLYIRQLGIGIRIEDDVIVTKSGHEVLTKEIAKHPDEIEAYMQGEKSLC